MYNGQPVKGNKGSCPYGSTWVEPSGDNKYAEGGNWFRDRYVTDKGNIDWGKGIWDASMLTGGLGIGKMLLGKSLAKGGKYLGDKLFRTNKSEKALAEQIKNNRWNATTTNTNRYGLPNPTVTTIPGRPAVQSRVINPATGKPYNLPPIPATTRTTPASNVLAPWGGAEAGKAGMKQLMNQMGSTRRLSPLKIGGAATLGLAGYDQLGPGLTAASKENRAMQAADQKALEQKALNENTAALMAKNKTEAEVQAEKDRRAGLGEWGRMQEDMKKPEFWSKNMGGGPNDTRMMRMAQLISWMGKTPNQKAQSTDPQKLWASAEKGVMDNIAALEKAQKTLSSKYGKPTVNNIADGMFDMVKEAYGGTWLPFDDKDDDELERISSLSAVRFIELSQDPMYMNLGEEQLRAEAIKQVGEELGIE